MARLQSNLRLEIKKRLQATEEKDQALSRLSNREDQLTSLRLGMTRVTSQMADLRLQHSAISEEVVHLASELQAQETSYFEGLQTLGDLLEAVSLLQAFAKAALDEHRASKDRWKDREKELTARFCLKVASFQMGFDGVVK